MSGTSIPAMSSSTLEEADLQGRLAVVASGMPEHRDLAAIRIRNRYAALHVARLLPARAWRSRTRRSFTPTLLRVACTSSRRQSWMPAMRHA